VFRRSLFTVVGAATCAVSLLAPAPAADAFCGFYVSGADAKLFNDATMVVMMREGQRTVLSMQNNYKGPPDAFAMVIPVPVVLQKENVKTLEQGIFDKVDAMAAPRLVEYWEQDPCKETDWERREGLKSARGARVLESAPATKGGVRIEAQFKVGEYDIVILSASDSTGLDTWLKANKYNIPAGAEPVLRPYVQAGTKFFVAKVDPKKVTFVGGEAKLSPLRFHYDAKTFSLPIRLGLLNAKGPQDLIVHVLARGKRYEVANYKNVTIPTNISVTNDVRKRFGEFYAALLDRTLEANKGSVVTEYAWDAATCDPCPGPTLNGDDMVTLGADVVPSKNRWGYVLTRLHARYTKDNLGEDLVFKEATPIVGGREMRVNGDLENRSRPGAMNNFQGRYIIRHKWDKPVTCKNPRYGRWGGPPGSASKKPTTRPALETSKAPRGKVQLASLVAVDIPEIGVKTAVKKADKAKPAAKKPDAKTPEASKPAAGSATATSSKPAPAESGAKKAPEKKSSGGCDAGGGPPGTLWALVLIALVLLGRRRKLLRGFGAAVVALALVGSPTGDANAFCGFYVSGADAKLFNDATMVVMMREGQRTVLSMQNNYKGPPDAFAMVIPVPVVLQKENVKTLNQAIFDKVDAMAAPRLVEYWEQDPCRPSAWEIDRMRKKEMVTATKSAAPGGGVTIEAQFKVGEYDIVILSASDSTGLDTWLKANKYNIPAGAEPVLRPYVQAGTKFFVAKVDPKKVKFLNGEAKLSPLRFHYDTKTFNLPIRLGLLNAKGPQDLIVHVLARGKRYEVANYKNVTIPTNINVTNDVRKRFGEFYAALLDKTLEANKGAVVTEYSWDAATCDPCPGPTLNGDDMAILGAEVMPSKNRWGYVLTRLHARYTKDNLGEDLVFKEAQPIVGGREMRVNGDLENRSRPGARNNFQGRYIIRHTWDKPVDCKNPRYGRWGGPPGSASKKPSTRPVLETSKAPRGKVKLASLVAVDIPEIGVKTSVKKTPATPAAPKAGAKTPDAKKPEAGKPAAGTSGGAQKAPEKKTSSGGCEAGGSSSGMVWGLVLLGLMLMRRRRQALRGLAAMVVALAVVATPTGDAEAFCGFYVGGAGAQLFNDATQVTLLREGQRTVLSMRNNYKGPPSNFAMVVPVPVVLKKKDVKTLPTKVFDRLDQLAAPRLVEYWEIDPCGPDTRIRLRPPRRPRMKSTARKGGSMKFKKKVKIEAQFKVGEYEIVILSATEAAALEKWLLHYKYNIPKGAAKVLRPYVQAGTKFFVAKVDVEKVFFKPTGEAVLSPLRFHYDTQNFNLPIRLGLLNAKGPQDLIVHILADKRYEVANYKNVTIPTNIEVSKATKKRFGEFYAALFDRTVEQNPRSVVTEYAWRANKCDPCPGPTLTSADIMTLGGDVVKNKWPGAYTLTRLHTRYTAKTLGEDLVFRSAKPIWGGREVRMKGKLEKRSRPATGVSNFQGRYIIRHKWKGKVACKNPQWGRWGGPPGRPWNIPGPNAARDLASAKRGSVNLRKMVREPIPELKLKPKK